MGTNYYVKIPGAVPFHLGKQSAMWPFIFHASDTWPQQRSLSLWVEMATFPGAVITDEYGREISFLKLMDKIRDSCDKYTQRHPDSYLIGGRFQFLTGEFC